MLNHLTLQGRLVADPEFGDTKAGTRYVNFRLAWSEKYKTGDKEIETKCFLDCKAFGGVSYIVDQPVQDRLPADIQLLPELEAIL